MSVLIETRAGGVVTLTLNRPEKHNAMDGALIDALGAAAMRLAEDPAARVVVLTGAGASFCAGGDLGWMRTQIGATRAERMAEARRLAVMLRALWDLPKPLIARVNGQAFGGGVGLISVSDVAIAAEAAVLGLTETRLGLIPATISPYVLAKMTPPRAAEVFFSSRRLGAVEAVRLGLVSRSVAADRLDDAVAAEAAPYAEAAPGAVADAKRLLRRLAPPIDAGVIEATVTALADRWETAEARAGVEAFFARRPAPWVAAD